MVNSVKEKKPKKKQRVASKHPCKVETELDKLSSLPSFIIDNILSHLSIRDAVRTSVLSRNWRGKWATLPSLVFDDQCFTVSSKDKLAIIIDRVLLLHKGPIHKFELSREDFEGVSDIDRWIAFISRSLIKEFILEIWKGERYQPSSCLFSFQNLTRLELLNCMLKPPSTFKGFKNLKILYFEDITIGQDVLENLISSSPLLERLTLIDFDGFSDLNIDAPNLQYIYASGVLHDVNFKNTFSLTSVSISFDDENIDHIQDEHKTDESSSKLLKFCANLLHIQRLIIMKYFLKYLACGGNIPKSLPNKFLDLDYLYINIDLNGLADSEATLCLLRSSPNLQELEIWSSTSEQRCAEPYTNLWGDDLGSSLFIHLRVATVNYVSGFKVELDFINFILSDAPALERLTVKPASKDVSLGLAKELLRIKFEQASSNLKIIYLDPDP